MITATLTTEVFEAVLDGGQFVAEYNTTVVEATLGSISGDVTIIEGGGGKIILPTAGAISALRAVSLDSSGELIYADCTDVGTLNVVGVALNSAVGIGELVTVVVSGEMEDAAWNWIVGDVYVGENGFMTQNPVGFGAVYSKKLGFAVAPNRLVVDMKITLEIA